MRRVALIFLLTVLLACTKEENKEPVCKFTSIGWSGSKLPVTYSNGDTVMTVGENDPGYKLYFSPQGRLIRREEPVMNPYYRSQLEYNASGQVTELVQYIKQGNSWVYEEKMVFAYDNGGMINLKEEFAVNQNGDIYDDEITWEGNDIQSVVHRLNQQPVCTTRFSYDSAMANPMRRFSYFYFCDGNANYTYYKLPYYFSEHLVTKQESDCPSSETRLFSYAFTGNGLIEAMTDQTGVSTGVLWEYEYECR